MTRAKWIPAALLLLATATSTPAEAGPISWELAVDTTILGVGELDPGFRSGATLDATLTFDPTAAEFLWADDFETGGGCTTANVRCVYRLPITISANVAGLAIDGSGDGTATLTRDTSLVLSLNQFDYGGRTLEGRSSIGFTLGYGTGFDPTSFAQQDFGSLPPDDFEHFFSMELDAGSGSMTAVAGRVTRIASVPESPAGAILLFVGAGLIVRRARRVWGIQLLS